MELKIFNHRLFALIAGIALSTAVFAQAKAVAPQTPDVQTEQSDDKAYQKEMATLQKEMAKLQLKMNKLRTDKSMQKMVAASKRFNKEFKNKFKGLGKDFGVSLGKDFGKDFSGSFNGMVPDMAGAFRGLNNLNFSSNFHVSLDSTGYQGKVAAGEITEKIKNYSKTYSVDANDVLQINNSFGKVTVNTWNKNEFKVDVQMKFSSDDEDAANDLFNGSSIDDSKVGSMVSFTTNLYHGESKRRNNHQNIEINYTVYMPAGNPLNIDNKFGTVVLPDLSGKSFIKVSYGSLTAGQLSNAQNEIDLRFGDGNSSIGSFNNGKVSVSYTKLRLGSVNNIDADIKFSGISIDRLRGSADVNIRYGDGLRIGTIEKTVKSINVDAQFSKINFDFKQLENFNFDVTTRFGSFNFDDEHIKITSKTPSDEDRGWSSTKSYKGYVGSASSSNKIVINASYTGVSFN